eukprot:16439073-Heterocapsa_arctica.AAC.1
MVQSAAIVGTTDVSPVVFVFPGVPAVWTYEGRGGIDFRQSGLRPRSSRENIPQRPCLAWRVFFSRSFIIFLGMVQSTVPCSPSKSPLPLAAFLQTAAVACWMASCSMSF